MEDSKFDVIVLGTGITESVVAAALSKWGFKVAHIDRNPYYGGEEASLTLDEFAKWIDTLSPTSERYSHATRSSIVPPFARQYSICLCPTINPSLGPFIDALIQSGVSKYSGFRVLDCVAVYNAAIGFKDVPGSKEDVFTNGGIPLIQKRRLMRFLTFAAGDFEQSTELQGKHDQPFVGFLESVFSLNKELVSVITYALAYSSSPADSAISVLPRIRRYLRSIGRYGSSPFLLGHYGGVGELSQGFCRAAAVNGTVYILGRSITSISVDLTAKDSTPLSHYYSVTLEDIPDPLFANVILGPASYLPTDLERNKQFLSVPPCPAFKAAYLPSCVVRCVAILDHPVSLQSVPSQQYSDDNSDHGEDDTGNEFDDDPKESALRSKSLATAVLIFPPGSLDGGSPDYSASVLITGEEALSTPKGKYILYICVPVPQGSRIEPSEILQPYLNSILKLGRDEPQDPLFTAFYAENLGEAKNNICDSQSNWIIPPPVPLVPLGDVADAAASNADTIFFEVLRALRDNGEKYIKDDSQNDGIWPRVVPSDEEDEI